MRAFDRMATAALMSGVAAHALAGTPRVDGYRKLSGQQIRAAFVGKELSDDVHFRVTYKADGTAAGYGMGRAFSRKWHVTGDQLCETEGDREICYSVWKKADAVRLLVDDSDVSTDAMLR